jgi:stearoyl-CoA desaturase (delta-9 desaturase)
MTQILSAALKRLISWFDTHHVPLNAPKTQEKGIAWQRWLPMVFMHLLCLAPFLVGWSWVAVITCMAMYLFRMFAITGFYHRYFSHRTFKVNRAMQFVLAVAGNSAVQRGPLWWAAHHRHHHLHSDQEDDAHSPIQHSLFWSHMAWIVAKENYATDLKSIPDLARFPELRFLDRFDTLVPVLLGVAMFFFGVALNYFWPGLGTNGWQMLVWGFFISTVVLFHGTCTINSLSHLFGSRRFATTDKSRNNFLLALITLGEGWHNNHHHYQSSVRQGFYWWEIDVTWYGLVIMSWLRLVKDLKPVPAKARVV